MKDELKNENDLKYEDNLKNEDELKNEDVLNIVPSPNNNFAPPPRSPITILPDFF